MALAGDDQAGAANLGQAGAGVEPAGGLEQAREPLRRAGGALGQEPGPQVAAPARVAAGHPPGHLVRRRAWEQPQRQTPGQGHEQPLAPGELEAGTAIGQDERRHALRVGQGEGLGHHAAKGVAARADARQAQMIQEGSQVLAQELDAAGGAGAARVPLPAQIVGDDPVVPGQGLNLGRPDAPGEPEARNEHHGRPLAPVFIAGADTLGDDRRHAATLQAGQAARAPRRPVVAHTHRGLCPSLDGLRQGCADAGSPVRTRVGAHQDAAILHTRPPTVKARGAPGRQAPLVCRTLRRARQPSGRSLPASAATLGRRINGSMAAQSSGVRKAVSKIGSRTGT